MLTNLLMRAASDSSGGSSYTLLSRVQANEVRAWERLVALYEPLVVSWCRVANVPEASIKPAVEKIFLAVAVGVADFHPDRLNCSFRTWIRTITRNLLEEDVQAELESGASGSDADQVTHVSVASSLASLSELVDEETLLFETALRLIQTEFASETFDLFAQTVLEQQLPQAVAEQLHVSLETVRLAKSRVLFRLRDEFGTLLD